MDALLYFAITFRGTFTVHMDFCFFFLFFLNEMLLYYMYLPRGFFTVWFLTHSHYHNESSDYSHER